MDYDELMRLREQVRARTHQALARSQEIATATLDGHTSRGTSDDGVVRVTLDGRGFLLHVDFDRAMADSSPEELSRSFLEAIGRARTEQRSANPTGSPEAILNDDSLARAYKQLILEDGGEGR